MAQTYHRVGFIAFGQRGQQLAETLIDYLPEYGAPVAVADLRPNPAVSPLISFRCPQMKYFTDYRELLAMPEIDSVIVSTYEDTHVEIVKAAIAAGKAVYCEKPVVPDLASAEELYRFVTGRECFFKIGLNLPNFPVALKLRELMERKIVGDLVMVRSDTDVGQNFARKFLLNKFSCKRGNFITAKITHDTDLLQMLAGSYAETVWGSTANFLWRRHGEEPMTDDTAVIAGLLHNGVMFTQTLTSSGARYERNVHFFGKLGEVMAEIHGDSVLVRYANGQEETIPAPNLSGGGHHGADLLTLRGFFDYVDAGIPRASEPERILSSVMIPMAALRGEVVKTGEWYRSVIGK